MADFTKDVLDHLKKSSQIVAMAAEDIFGQSVFHEWKDLKIESPIEQLLYTALKLVAEVNAIERFDDRGATGQPLFTGLRIVPQYVIGKYRADFLVEYHPWQGAPKSVLVECDSQQFHERTEAERRYEKARDRYLIQHGHQVFHYTGKEIKDGPEKVAADILGHVVGFNSKNMYEAVLDLAANLNKD